MHSVVMPSVSFSAAKDMVRITAPADRNIRVKKVTVYQDTDASPQYCIVGLYRASNAGTGGTTAQVNAFELDNETYQGTAVYNLSGDTTKSPTVALVRYGSDMTIGWEWCAEDEEADIEIAMGGSFVVRLDSAPTGATVFTVTVELKQST